MKCKNCGEKIYPNDKFCPYCGNQIKKFGRKGSFAGGKKPLQEKYLRGEFEETSSDTEYISEEYYDEEDYYEYEDKNEEEEYEYVEKKRSGWSILFLLLILALVIGFIIGILVFTNQQATPNLPINSS
jgi:ribosomal protein L32